jgi:hypothetical protein
MVLIFVKQSFSQVSGFTSHLNSFGPLLVGFNRSTAFHRQALIFGEKMEIYNLECIGREHNSHFQRT